MEFENVGERYRVTRSKTTAKLVCLEAEGERLVANGNTPVTAEVESMLDLSAKDYNLFVQSRQGETSGVPTFGATALNNKVEEFADISLVDEVRTRASGVASQVRARVEGLATEERLKEVHQECHAAANALQKAMSELLAEPLLSKLTVSAEALIRAQRQAQLSIASLRRAEELLVCYELRATAWWSHLQLQAQDRRHRCGVLPVFGLAGMPQLLRLAADQEGDLSGA
ncbi:hypothetical protein [Pseudomonas sp. JUb52]|uniref:hypothetical protein n=1 Tax=Pseudomonas sp. JUb52 TaxID=2485127 RepID=UPI00104E49BB|nr:hypothetical protein [Pseudomonas sp. JUb52]TCQ81597.1 hypothetical protein EC839_1264 [Pseudomonas sp. JUb52]